MIGQPAPFRFRILRTDPFSKVVSYVGKTKNIEKETLLLKWGSVAIDTSKVLFKKYSHTHTHTHEPSHKPFFFPVRIPFTTDLRKKFLWTL